MHRQTYPLGTWVLYTANSLLLKPLCFSVPLLWIQACLHSRFRGLVVLWGKLVALLTTHQSTLEVNFAASLSWWVEPSLWASIRAKVRLRLKPSSGTVRMHPHSEHRLRVILKTYRSMVKWMTVGTKTPTEIPKCIQWTLKPTRMIAFQFQISIKFVKTYL